MPNPEIELKDGERIDQLGYHGLRIIQDPSRFKFTIDAYLLAGFVETRPDDHLIDLGCGGGVLALLIAGQRQLKTIIGLEIQPEMAEMASRSVLLNELTQKIRIIRGDLREIPEEIKRNAFDWVISNPPFFEKGNGLLPPNNALARAKFELDCSLAEVVRAATQLVKGNGKVALIYPAGRLPELLEALRNSNLNPVRLQLVHSKPGALANLVLCEARPNSRRLMQVMPPLFIYDQKSTYSSEMMRIFKGAPDG
jgi:tRNA1Val (adenine37-N6)-methyltransferase